MKEVGPGGVHPWIRLDSSTIILHLKIPQKALLLLNHPYLLAKALPAQVLL